MKGGPHQRKFSGQAPGEESWTFVASGRTDPYNWEVWIEPDPFGRGRRCERFKVGTGSRAEWGSGLCGYELPLDFSGPSIASGTDLTTVSGIVSPKAVRVVARLDGGNEVAVPELVAPSDRSDRLYFFYAGARPTEMIAYDAAGSVVGRRATTTTP